MKFYLAKCGTQYTFVINICSTCRAVNKDVCNFILNPPVETINDQQSTEQNRLEGSSILIGFPSMFLK